GRARGAVRGLPARGYRLRDLHEGRKHCLPEDPLRLPLLDLCRLRDRDDRALHVARCPCCSRQGTGSFRSYKSRLRRMNLTSPFSIALIIITALAFLGLPIGLSMMAGSILYLYLAGADMGTVAEQFLNGMYSN